MKILSPIDNIAEVEALAEAGADEFYGGFVSAAWRRKYSLLGSANHRYFPNAQVKSEKELREIVRASHRAGKKFYLAMNAPYYLAGQYEDLLKDARRFYALGVDSFIVSDIGLILRLKDKLPDAAVHLSTLGTVFNPMSASFFASLGIRRIVLPRELTVREVRGIVKANPGVEFDAFVFIGKCPNIEGFCSFTHDSPDLIWPCEQEYDFATVDGDGGAEVIINAQAGWSRVNRRQACGLCAVSALRDAGIAALKIVGRGGPTAMKIKSIAAVREAVSLAGQGAGEEALMRRAKKIYRKTFGVNCNRYICYFPEFWSYPTTTSKS